MANLYVDPDGRTVAHPGSEPVVFVGGTPHLTSTLVGSTLRTVRVYLELMGAGDPAFCVVVCAWCDAVMRVRGGGTGTTHSVCPACVAEAGF